MHRRFTALLRRSPATAVAVGALVMAMGGLAAAQAIPDAHGVIHACANKRSGAMRVVAKANACRKSERALAFDQKGRTGAPGLQGPKGDTGAQGPKGDTGPAGPSGAAPAAHQDVVGTARLTDMGTHVLTTFPVLGFDVTRKPSGTMKLTLVKAIGADTPGLFSDSGRAFTLALDLDEGGGQRIAFSRRYDFGTTALTSDDQQAPSDGSGLETLTFAVTGWDVTAGTAAQSTPAAPSIGIAGFGNAPPVHLYGVHFGMTAGTVGGGSGGTIPPPTLDHMSVTVGVGDDTTTLLDAIVAGTKLSQVQVALANGQSYALTGVGVTSVHDHSDGREGDPAPLEDVELAPSKVIQTDDGSSACWNLASGQLGSGTGC